MMINFQKNTSSLTTISIGVVYLWFGILKFVPDLSPAEELAKHTINELTFGIIPANIAIILLAVWETIIGLFLILNIKQRIVINFAIAHILCTFSPLVFFSHQVFGEGAFTLTLLGQYIIKNLIILSVLIQLLMEIKRKTIKSKKNKFGIPTIFLPQRYFQEDQAKS